MIEVRLIDATHKEDINISNEPFPLRGRMIIEHTESGWSHREELLPLEKTTEMVFPDENYKFEEMKEYIFLGAYEGETCVGVAILCPAFNPCLFLYALKVNSNVRGKGIGRLLIEEAFKIAKRDKYAGLYTVGQDNNLNACLFYLSCGFIIGGLDTEIYKGTKQEGKSDIYFYKR
jgi:GNAT superfamily N-acetyltransferase